MSRRLLWSFVAVVVASRVVEVSALADDWGALRGRFVYGANPPMPQKIVVTKDLEVCGKHSLFDESLVVDKDRGIANVVVYVRTRNVKIHPDLEKSAAPRVTLDNAGCRFEPHILPMWVGKQTLVLSNSDPVGHNSNLQPFGDQGINPLIPAGGSVEHRLNRGQRIPVPVSCNLHPWMKAYIVPRENPYVAVSGKGGVFKLEKLPIGALDFQAWQEKAGYVAIPGWERGRFSVSIKEGVNDLGEITLSPELFKR